MLKFETERLTIRKMVNSDFNAFRSYYAQPEVQMRVACPNNSREAMRKDFDNLITNPLSWGIEQRYNGLLIGNIHYFNVTEAYLAEVGYILSPEYWGRGYMTEVLREVIAFGFDLGLGRIRAKVEPDNIASIRLLESCGFSREAMIYEDSYGDRVVDLIYFTKTKN